MGRAGQGRALDISLGPVVFRAQWRWALHQTRYCLDLPSLENHMNFQTQHLATLAKYAGISFIAGAVNHGMFSEQRSFLTAALGVVFYLLGAAMELKASNDAGKRWGDLLGFGIVASIGLGFFSGGLQHFPDSPERSLWVVPLGFFLSLLALYFSQAWRDRMGLKPLAISPAAPVHW